MASVISSELMSAMGGSFAACSVLVATQRWHGKLTFDHDLQGAQKIHKAPVPRIGGLGVAIGLMVAAIVASALGGRGYELMLTMLVCATPVFIAGLIEDLTKKVSVRKRLFASFGSAALGIWMLDAQLTRLDTPGLDSLITIMPISMLFTCFAVGGMTNAINIIDGLNGLAAGCVAMMLAGLAGIAWQVGDTTVMNLCLWGIAALVGFLILNFPFGRIFLGDGGAYLAGFWVAECGILLLDRNPNVSTWAVLLCCLYPVWETVFSVYRRQIVQRVSSGMPDMTHMHHLVFKHISQNRLQRRSPAWLSHGLSSALIWATTAMCPIVAAAAYDQTWIMMLSVLCFALSYSAVYKALVQQRTARNVGSQQNFPPVKDRVA